jgi:hypothetical protein
MNGIRLAYHAALLFLIPLAGIAGTPPSPGESAPDFTLKDSGGKTHSLSIYRGRYVVLEWVNFGCPFVQKHYNSGNMPALQKTYTAKNVVWLSICSSAPGREGYLEGDALPARMARMNAVPSAYLIDAEGKVGRLFAAKSTPTMFVIDPQGKIVYSGGIDNMPSTNTDDIAKARNFVREALDLSLAGKSVEISSSRAYGCSVKYAD